MGFTGFYQLYWPNCNDKIYIYLELNTILENQISHCNLAFDIQNY